jgi:hypothetical protein
MKNRSVAGRLGERPDGKTSTRPLCGYPAVTNYQGIGSTDDAANFQCVVTKYVR